MGVLITNSNGGDVSFYAAGNPVVVVNGASVEIDEASADALMNHPVFAAMVEGGQLAIAMAAEAPATNKGKAAEAPSPAHVTDKKAKV